MNAAGQRLAAALLLVAGATAFVFQTHYAWPFTADDAFITFRYAKNWVDGFGPNFNTDGTRAEGVTSFAFLALSTLPHLLRSDAVAFAKAVGVLCALACAALAALLARDLAAATARAIAEPAGKRGARPPADASRLAAAFAASLFLGLHATAIHAASGMETLLAAALLTALVRAVVRETSGAQLGGLSLGLGLVRPELNAVAALLLALALWRARPPRRIALARGIAFAYLVPGAVYFAARAAYYGHLFPLPFYAKVAGGALFPAAASVLEFAAALLARHALFVAIPLVLAPAVYAPALLAIGAVMALGLLPDPVMDFDYRYCMPAAPIAAAIAGVGFAEVVRAVTERYSMRTSLPAWLALAAIAWLVASGAEPARDALRERRAYGEALANTQVRLGHVLADFARTAARPPVIALGDVGAIPYYSGLRVIDTFSLNEPAIVVGGRDDPNYVLDQEPDLVAVVSEQGREFSAHWANRHDTALFAACRARGMQPAVILSFSARSFVYLMARPGSEIARHLQRVYLAKRTSAAG